MQINSSISIDNLDDSTRKVQTEVVRIDDIDFTNPIHINRVIHWISKAHAAALAIQECSKSDVQEHEHV